MPNDHTSHADEGTAERIRAALIQAAIDGYEQASLSGLCDEGALEAAVSAMRRLDLHRFLTTGGEAPG